MDQTAAIVLATLSGPIIAVIITLFYQNWDRRYQRKLAIFRSLMQWRANWLNPEWVGALNMIPVEFSGQTEILNSFTSLLDKFSDSGFRGTGDDLNAAYSKAETVFVELIQKIARELKIDISTFDLRGRVYAPSGWANKQAAILSLRASATEILNGERAVKVSIVNSDVL